MEHKISIEDFKDYEVEKELAIQSGGRTNILFKSIVLKYNVLLNKAVYKVKIKKYNEDAVDFLYNDIENAIDKYNEE